jgi:hypothetical protein
MNAARVRKLLLAGSRLPEITAEDEAAVSRAIQEMRQKRKQ